MFQKRDFEILTPKILDEEQDILDLVHGVKEGSSRLGCQLILNKDMDGVQIEVPKSVNDLRADP
jgi:cytochrome c oxidase assembly protein subunit 15